MLFIYKYEDFFTVRRYRTPESILTYAPSAEHVPHGIFIRKHDNVVEQFPNIDIN